MITYAVTRSSSTLRNREARECNSAPIGEEVCMVYVEPLSSRKGCIDE